jgi:flavodoxin
LKKQYANRLNVTFPFTNPLLCTGVHHDNVVVFSDTGNTYWSAKQIARRIREETEVLNIAAEMLKPPGIITAEKIVILFPASAWQMPYLARRFILRTEFWSPYIAALVTYGTNPGGALAEA